MVNSLPHIWISPHSLGTIDAMQHTASFVAEFLCVCLCVCLTCTARPFSTAGVMDGGWLLLWETVLKNSQGIMICFSDECMEKFNTATRKGAPNPLRLEAFGSPPPPNAHALLCSFCNHYTTAATGL